MHFCGYVLQVYDRPGTWIRLSHSSFLHRDSIAGLNTSETVFPWAQTIGTVLITGSGLTICVSYWSWLLNPKLCLITYMMVKHITVKHFMALFWNECHKPILYYKGFKCNSYLGLIRVQSEIMCFHQHWNQPNNFDSHFPTCFPSFVNSEFRVT